jgi:outer membrane protein assembly factor BamB
VVNGIVFVATSGAVNAFDARSGKIVWSTALASAGGTIAEVHWQSPIVANGSLYISDEAGSLTAYSLTR